MFREEISLIKILHAPHISEKASAAMGVNNTIVLKVAKNATKSAIKTAMQQLFEVKVQFVNTLLVKGKSKKGNGRNGSKQLGRRRDWKKAYITLKKGQHLDLISGA